MRMHCSKFLYIIFYFHYFNAVVFSVTLDLENADDELFHGTESSNRKFQYRDYIANPGVLVDKITYGHMFVWRQRNTRERCSVVYATSKFGLPQLLHVHISDGSGDLKKVYYRRQNGAFKRVSKLVYEFSLDFLSKREKLVDNTVTLYIEKGCENEKIFSHKSVVLDGISAVIIYPRPRFILKMVADKTSMLWEARSDSEYAVKVVILFVSEHHHFAIIVIKKSDSQEIQFMEKFNDVWFLLSREVFMKHVGDFKKKMSALRHTVINLFEPPDDSCFMIHRNLSGEGLSLTCVPVPGVIIDGIFAGETAIWERTPQSKCYSVHFFSYRGSLKLLQMSVFAENTEKMLYFNCENDWYIPITREGFRCLLTSINCPNASNMDLAFAIGLSDLYRQSIKVKLDLDSSFEDDGIMIKHDSFLGIPYHTYMARNGYVITDISASGLKIWSSGPEGRYCTNATFFFDRRFARLAEIVVIGTYGQLGIYRLAHGIGNWVRVSKSAFSFHLDALSLRQSQDSSPEPEGALVPPNFRSDINTFLDSHIELDLSKKLDDFIFYSKVGVHKGIIFTLFRPYAEYCLKRIQDDKNLIWEAQTDDEICTMGFAYSVCELNLLARIIIVCNGDDKEKFLRFSVDKWQEVTQENFYSYLDALSNNPGTGDSDEDSLASELALHYPSLVESANPDDKVITDVFDDVKDYVVLDVSEYANDKFFMAGSRIYQGVPLTTIVPKDDYTLYRIRDGSQNIWEANDEYEKCGGLDIYHEYGVAKLIKLNIVYKNNRTEKIYLQRIEGIWTTVDRQDFYKFLPVIYARRCPI